VLYSSCKVVKRSFCFNQNFHAGHRKAGSSMKQTDDAGFHAEMMEVAKCFAVLEWLPIGDGLHTLPAAPRYRTCTVCP